MESIGVASQVALPNLVKQKKTGLHVRHYGDWSNPVEHSHLYRWGADQTQAKRPIKARKPKKKGTQTTILRQFESESEFVVLNEVGGYVVVNHT